MTQPISRQMHGPLADYPFLLAAATAPEAVGFADESPTAATLCRAIAGGVLATSLMTRAEWGLARVVPFKAHLALDAGVSLFSLAAPWLFGFADKPKARDTFLAMGVVGLIAGALTRPEEMPDASAKAATPKAKYARAVVRAASTN